MRLFLKRLLLCACYDDDVCLRNVVAADVPAQEAYTTLVENTPIGGIDMCQAASEVVI